LGLQEADVAFEDLQDPYGIEFWPEFKGRDGCRTPMVWEMSNLNGGFSDAKPWLPASHDHLHHSVEAHAELTAKGNVLSLRRAHADQEMFCAINLSDTPQTIEMPHGNWEPVAADLGSTGAGADRKLHLGPWQPCFAVRKN
jgi:alpha-glucosidase